MSTVKVGFRAIFSRSACICMRHQFYNTPFNSSHPPNNVVGFQNTKRNYAAHTNCWKCKTKVYLKYGEFACKCGVLQAPAKYGSYFEVFDEEPKFALDIETLAKKYRFLQSVLHPDKFSQKSKEEQENSQLQSTLVNNAYRTLKDPMSRGLHLLETKGQIINEDDKVMDSEFLMKIMEFNEQVAEISNAQEYHELLAKNNDTLSELFSQLNIAFENGDISEAKDVLKTLKYFSNLQEKLQEKRHLYDC